MARGGDSDRWVRIASRRNLAIAPAAWSECVRFKIREKLRMREMGRWGDGEDEVTKSPPIPFTAWHAALRLQVPKSPMDRPMRWCEGLGGLMAGLRQDFRSNWPLVLIQ